MQQPTAVVSAALVCALLAARSADAGPPNVVTYPAKVEHAATLKLLAAEGKTGRENPFYDNYRPQLVFSGERGGTTCEVHLIKPQEKVDPGETADVKLSCLEKFKVVQDRLEFTGLEGGRLVITGRLK